MPGSKSLTNRALVCAALADGRSTLRGALEADDTEAMVGCLRAVGIGVRPSWRESTIEVDGTGGAVPPGPAEVDARQSGTTARFVAPLLALGSGAYRLTGAPQLLLRPMGPVLDGLADLGVTVVAEDRPGHLPVRIEAPGGLAGGRLRQPGHVSSQFLSGLLLAGPAMADGLVVELTSELVSRPYVELTESVMAAFGVEVGRGPGPGEYVVPRATYRATEYAVEPDASAASYFFAAAAVCGGRVRVEGLGRSTAQGDIGFVELLRAMGAEVEVGDGYTEVRGTGRLRGITADLADLSDTAPTLACVAAFASSPSRLTGIGFIRGKETDRIAAVVAELQRCGVDADEEEDGLVVRPAPAGLHGARVQTYDDHRMAMSFAVVGLRVPGIVLVDPGCVAKTFPRFFETLDGLR
ncbi:MAG: 3-phosphoshikimate 1-carboxyvinyltransferase [Acidimicrobiia bacterium]|nr:3-phosphoshikimate 1-carboxyvinyltransferase [Acidimicrobiia bacterium]